MMMKTTRTTRPATMKGMKSDHKAMPETRTIATKGNAKIMILANVVAMNKVTAKKVLVAMMNLMNLKDLMLRIVQAGILPSKKRKKLIS